MKPDIIILEGVNAAGKDALITNLARYGYTGYGPFRGLDYVDFFHNYGYDDMVSANVFGSIDCGRVALNRCIISDMIYRSAHNDPNYYEDEYHYGSKGWRDILKVYFRLMSQRKLLFVLLDVTWPEALNRRSDLVEVKSGKEFTINRHMFFRMRNAYRLVYHELPRLFPKDAAHQRVCIETTHISKKDTFGMLEAWL